MDLKQSLKYSVKPKTTPLYYGLLILIPIIGFILQQGYIVRVYQEVGKKNQKRTPKFEKWWEMFKQGLTIIILGLTLSLIISIIPAIGPLIGMVLPLYFVHFFNQKGKLSQKLDPTKIIKAIINKPGEFILYLIYVIGMILIGGIIIIFLIFLTVLSVLTIILIPISLLLGLLIFYVFGVLSISIAHLAATYYRENTK